MSKFCGARLTAKSKFNYFACASSLSLSLSLHSRYGTQSLSLKSYIQPIVSLLADPTATVRDAAIQTLVEVYKHVGKSAVCSCINGTEFFFY